MRASRALDRLRDHLQKRGITSTAAALGALLAQNAVCAAPPGLASTAATVALAASAAGGSVSVAAAFMASKLTLGAATALGVLAMGAGVLLETRAVKLERLADSATSAAQSISAVSTAAAFPKSAPFRPEHASATPQAEQSKPGETLHEKLIEQVAAGGSLRQLEGRAYLAQMRLRYAAFFRSQSLGREQEDSFEKILLRAASESVDLAAAAANQGVDRSSETLRSLSEAVVQKRNAEIAQTYGQAFLVQLQDYEKNQSALSAVSALGSELALGSEPLSQSQAQSLVPIVRSHTSAASPLSMEDASVDWVAAIREAAPLLSSGQLGALKAIQAKVELESLKSQARDSLSSNP